MIRDLFLYATFLNDLFQLLAHRPIVDFTEYQPVCREMLVSFDYQQGYIKQFYLEGNICFVTFADNSFLTINFYDFIRCQFLHVHKTECRETGKHEQVTDE